RAGRPHDPRGQRAGRRRGGRAAARVSSGGDRHPRRRSSLIVERTENPQWLSNAYLVADPERGTGVLIDGIEITHYLVTHPHADHVAGIKEARERLGGPPLVAHAETAAELDEEVAV